MPIPLYISPNTPLPGPADFATPMLEAFKMRQQNQHQAQDMGLRREQMAMQKSENAADREQRGAERKETNAYNQGMLKMYQGDREQREAQRIQEAEDKAHQEYLLAYMKNDQAGMELAQQKIAQLRKKQAQPAAPAREPPPGLGAVGPSLSSSRLF